MRSKPILLEPAYFQIAGISLKVSADLAIQTQTFDPKFRHFRDEHPGEDLISLHHHFSIPPITEFDLGQLIQESPPWAIYKGDGKWTYLGILPESYTQSLHKLAFFNECHTHGEIYSPDASLFLAGQLHSLTLFPTDQIVLARVLADRQGCYLHAAGLVIDGQGLAFVGHSEAGKSTITRQLMPHGEVLCDDRVILRRWPGGFKVHGTWSHGEIAEVSLTAAPLRALLLLEKANENRLIPMERKEIVRRLPQFVVRPLVTSDWWEKTLELVGAIAREVPVYRLRFDRSGDVIQLLGDLIG